MNNELNQVEVRDKAGKGVAIADGLLRCHRVAGCDVTADPDGKVSMLFYDMANDILEVIVMPDVPFTVKMNALRAMARHVRDGSRPPSK